LLTALFWQIPSTLAANYYTMNIITLSEDNYKELKEQLAEIKSQLQLLQPRDSYWDNSDVIQKLKVSERTLATWREKGMIRYSKVGAKIYYKEEDIIQFLENNVQEVHGKRS
jgi:DNA-binding transcriptional MerR regulator